MSRPVTDCYYAVIHHINTRTFVPIKYSTYEQASAWIGHYITNHPNAFTRVVHQSEAFIEWSDKENTVWIELSHIIKE